MTADPFWWGWPSWWVELGGGTLLATAAQPLPSAWFPHHEGLRLAATSAISFGYEMFADSHGWEWHDVGQRAVGIAIGLVLWHVIRRVVK